MRKTIFFMQILLLLMAGSAFGADIYYLGRCGPNPNPWRSYWWQGSTDNRYSNPLSWWNDGQEYFPPGPDDVASLDNPLPLRCLINSGDTAECFQLQVGHFPANSGTEPLVATLDVNGGTLTVGEDILIGLRDQALPADYAIGDVNIISGTVTVGCDLYIGREGIGILNMRGGTCDVTGTIWCPGGPLPAYNGQTYESGTGQMNLHGGTLSAADIDVWSDDTTEMDIRGGTLILDGDRTGKLKGYVQVDKLFAYGGRGEVIMDYNSTKTTVTADVNYVLAWGSRPRNYAIDVEPDANLSWGPGDDAVKHDVYFGTDYSEVSEANDPNLLPIGRGRKDSNSYDPGMLVSDTTYYWRIDEVNDVNGLTVHKGRIWEFKIRNLALAYDPYPADGQDDVQLPLTLDWTEGLGAVNHDVYFGTDFNDVNDANTSVPLGVYQDNVSDSNYPPSGLILGTEYYWRIDEVNGPNTWKGKVWSFTLNEYFGIDWFEDYGTTENLLNTWSGSNCSLALWDTDPVTDGNAMQISYWPSNPPGHYAEAVMTVPAGRRDWTVGDAKVLELKFKGIENNQAQKVYVDVNSSGTTKMVVHPDPNMLVQQSHEDWVWWPIDLDVFADADVNLSNVTKLTIGIGDKLGSSPGTSGYVYVDDIALRGPLCYNHDGDADLNNDCAVDIDDIELLASDWFKRGYDVVNVPASDANLVVWYKFDEGSGTTAADSAAPAQNGKLLFPSWKAPGHDGTGSCVWFVDQLSISVPPVAAKRSMGGYSTVAMWIKDDGVDETMAGFTTGYIGAQLFQAGPSGQGNLQVVLPYNGYFQYTCGWNTDKKWEDSAVWSGKWGWGYSNGDHPLKQWVHYAFAKDATEGVMRIYQNGKIVAEQDDTTGLLMPAIDPLFGYFTLGAWKWTGGTGGYYYGLMDDFRLYSRALSQQEIMSLAGVSFLHQPVVSSAEVTDDDIVNFKDFAVAAAEWLEEPLLWPY